MFRPPPGFSLFPYTTLFRSRAVFARGHALRPAAHVRNQRVWRARDTHAEARGIFPVCGPFVARLAHAQRLRRRSEEHTSELQSHSDLVCRLLLEKKK